MSGETRVTRGRSSAPAEGAAVVRDAVMRRLLGGVRAVGFDLDGTLIDTVPDLEAAANTMLGLIGAPKLAPGRVRELVGDGIAALVQRVLRESPGERTIGLPTEETALDLFRSLYGQRLFDRSRVYPHVQEMLEVLARSGLVLGCITNKDGSLAQPLLAAAGLTRWLSFCLTPENSAQRKPEPYLLTAAAERLHLSAAQLLYVGDMRTDIEAARAAGCPVVAVSYGYHSGAPLSAFQPDAVIDSLEEPYDL